MASLEYKIKSGTLTVREDNGNSFTIQASSGKGTCLNQPSCADRSWEGPIPPGDYVVGKPDDPGMAWDVLRSTTGDWGDWRAPLVPRANTQTFGRSNFFIHGGSIAGSAGCIDVGGGLTGNDQTDRLKAALEKGNAALRVDE